MQLALPSWPIDRAAGSWLRQSARCHRALASAHPCRTCEGGASPASAWGPWRLDLYCSGITGQAAVLLVACALSAFATAVVLSRAENTKRLDGEVVAAHVRSLLQDSPIQVASSDTHTVKPWFSGRLDFSPPVKDLTPEGFQLIGGRVDYIGGNRVATLVYRRHLHVVTVFCGQAEAGMGSCPAMHRSKATMCAGMERGRHGLFGPSRTLSWKSFSSSRSFLDDGFLPVAAPVRAGLSIRSGETDAIWPLCQAAETLAGQLGGHQAQCPRPILA